MKKKIVYTIVALFAAMPLYAQHAIGSWQTYLSYHNVTHSEPAGNLIYALGNGSLFSYDKEDTSVHRYQKGNPLSDTDIAYIAYQSTYKTLIIVYSNANIDLLVNDEDVYNLPDYMNKNMAQNKDINHIYFIKEYAYLSTPFGIVVLNLKKREISNAYILNKKINACAVDDKKIYAASSEGLFTGLLTDNLLDVNNWKKVSNNIYSCLSIYNNELIGNIVWGINLINKEDYSYSQLISGYYNFMNTYGDKFIVGNSNSLAIFSSLDKNNKLNHQLRVSHFSYDNGTYWASRYNDGLVGYKYNEQSNKLEETVQSIIPDSPKRNYTYYMTFEDESLLIAGGGQIGNRLERAGTIMELRNNTWNNFQEDGIKEVTNQLYRDISCVIQDPNDPEHHFAASVGEGLYEFRNKKFVKQYSMHNSALESADKNSNVYIRINGLKFDNDNNLWMTNYGGYKATGVQNPIKILKADGKWVSLRYPEITGVNNLENTLFDKRGWFWVTSAWMANYGVFCVNTKNTLEDVSDHQHKFVSNFTNQDGTALNHKSINCIAEDKNGVIWIGTGQGPIILNNPSKFFDDDFYCTQIKVPRNDGTNLADFLLENDEINAIAIDGGNRKWIGTGTNGVYLLSPDGLETIHHFTTENSPLLSNSIESIAINPNTGEVFIGTSKGLVSYQSDAIEPKSSFKKEDVYAFPNPVKPDYTGVVTVTGLVQDTDVKITNVSGKLIYAGTSVGGQFTWDGKNQQGRRVPSGVYFVLAADADGKEGIATKILFIK
ncbi:MULTISPECIES: two-component regulator propeller domain-containing protein [Bacteroides]|uniref:type IX secretion system anionic LPS delivery protein PorZ n=1 Tax=Bacteroides TaxID=816 RepID=UPI00259D171B|nr:MULTISPECIES: two-component regulator propeller domain-containing protein [Bacteroides]